MSWLSVVAVCSLSWLQFLTTFSRLELEFCIIMVFHLQILQGDGCMAVSAYQILPGLIISRLET
jgi:hypothetical protein